MENTCTGENCDDLTDLHLCNRCIHELRDTLNQIPALIPILNLITIRQEQPFTNRTNTSTTGGSPSTPLNLSSEALASNLRMALGRTAHDYAHDTDAGWAKSYIEDQVTKADLMVNGEPEIRMTPDYITYRMKQVLPMPTKHLIPWFAETLNIRLTDTRIRKWAERGRITRTNQPGQHPTYHPADILRAHENRNNGRQTDLHD